MFSLGNWHLYSSKGLVARFFNFIKIFIMRHLEHVTLMSIYNFFLVLLTINYNLDEVDTETDDDDEND
ncbi:hypothetical protein BpHYR1_039599 [Brachionus plicatilis]|uniref:Uncharacterized protein n=1 Tax=Brachionus plicatilis TaxID=10195 RepID=A0A3M7QPS5_BRAPC|nr:hypothetical protein BpHYR1_039599 [Brachionus plicatilis]